MVTLKDIAVKTGFSVSVVSRAMNPSPDQKVADKTREVIMNTAREMGYRPNHAASLLAKGRSAAIGCFMPVMVGEMVGRIVDGLSHVANQAGFAYQIYFGNSLDDYRRFIDHCQHTSAAGMITYLPGGVVAGRQNSEFYDMLRSLTGNSGEIIMLNCPDLELPHVQTVCIDNYYIGQLAAQYLMDQGCRKCVLVSGCIDKYVSFQLWQRDEGFAGTVLANKGHFERIAHKINRDYSSTDTAFIARLQEMLKTDSPVGLFVLTDYEACVVYRQLAEQNMQHLIGKTIKIIGCDNIIVSALLEPGLTTVSLLEPFFALGEISMSMLLNKLVKANLPVDMERLKPQLVIRGSA